MECIVDMHYQCIDAKTDPGLPGVIDKNGFQGFRPTPLGEKMLQEDLLFIDNGIIERATHLAIQFGQDGIHVVGQQAGPDINMANGYGSVCIFNDGSPTITIDGHDTADNLRGALAEVKHVVTKRGVIMSQVVFTVIGHNFCGNIRTHALDDLDINFDGVVTPEEYVFGEQRLRAQVRARQREALISILGDVLGDVAPVTLRFSRILQQKFAGDPEAAQEFVNKAVGQEPPPPYFDVTEIN